MTKGFLSRLAFAILATVAFHSARADAPIKFDEVFSLVRSNLTELSEADINKAAATGFIEKLGGKVELTDLTASSSNQNIIAKTNAFDSFGYVRLIRVAPGVGDQISDAIKSNRKLKGVVLDLRFAKGDDYEAAIEAANAFIDGEQTLLKWGDQNGKTKSNPGAIKLPVVVLVNRQTTGAAEALAGALSISQAALMVGNRTAGQAMAFQDFPLSSGQHLRIARSRVELGTGKPIGSEGLTPDIIVEVEEKNERSWLDDPYRVINRPGSPAGPQPFLSSVTNRFGRRMNGAEVGRRHREEVEQDEHPDAPPTAAPRQAAPPPEERVVQDPALVRALDFLKGITATKLRDVSSK
jgi:C-terminal processing protease CtpA/Prc